MILSAIFFILVISGTIPVQTAEQAEQEAEKLKKEKELALAKAEQDRLDALAEQQAELEKEKEKAVSEKEKDLADELADVLFVLICIANQTDVDLTDALCQNLEKKTDRDATRHEQNPKLKFIVVPISWLLMPITKLVYRIPFVKILNVVFEIEKLERQNRINEARRLRHSWLKNPKYSYSAELLFSEANDLLFNLEDYSNALKTYEMAIKINPNYNPIDM